MKTEWNGYEIESKFVGEKCSSWDSANYDRHHVITVSNGRNEKISFDFWTSKAKPQITEEKELLEAVENFFVDAESGQNDFYDFCNEMGYDVPRGAYESWKACVVANAKMQAMFGNDWDKVADELREAINV